MSDLTKLKDEFEWLSEAPSQVLQQSVFDLDSAFSHFFKKNSAFPRFKSRHDSKQSCRFPQGFAVNRESKYLKFPKLGWVRFIDKFNVPKDADFRQVTISKKGSNYFASIIYDVPEKKIKQHPIVPNRTVGIDLGVKTLITLSTGKKIDNPKHLGKHLEELKVEQQELSKLTKGTFSYRKQRGRVQKVYEKVSNIRKDFLHKFTTGLAENQSWTTICVEDLNIKGLLQSSNTGLSRAIGDASWGALLRMLEYKLPEVGKNLIKIGRFDASSKTCICGVVNHDLKLSDRTWTCKACGTKHDRDVLAANNITTFGLRKAGQSLAG